MDALSKAKIQKFDSQLKKWEIIVGCILATTLGCLSVFVSNKTLYISTMTSVSYLLMVFLLNMLTKNSKRHIDTMLNVGFLFMGIIMIAVFRERTSFLCENVADILFCEFPDVLFLAVWEDMGFYKISHTECKQQLTEVLYLLLVFLVYGVCLFFSDIIPIWRFL